jgi:hypothetical protein
LTNGLPTNIQTQTPEFTASEKPTSLQLTTDAPFEAFTDDAEHLIEQADIVQSSSNQERVDKNEKQMEKIVEMRSSVNTQAVETPQTNENPNKKKPIQQQNQQNQYETQINILKDENDLLKRRIDELIAFNKNLNEQIENQNIENEDHINEINQLKSNNQQIDRSKLMYIATTIFNSLGTPADLENININPTSVETSDKMVTEDNISCIIFFDDY